MAKKKKRKLERTFTVPAKRERKPLELARRNRGKADSHAVNQLMFLSSPKILSASRLTMTIPIPIIVCRLTRPKR